MTDLVPPPRGSGVDAEPVAADWTSNSNESADTPILFRDVAPAVEFGCWVVVGLAAMLRWVNGAAVTDDQFVVQVALTALAAVGAIALRLYNRNLNKDVERA